MEQRYSTVILSARQSGTLTEDQVTALSTIVAGQRIAGFDHDPFPGHRIEAARVLAGKGYSPTAIANLARLSRGAVIAMLRPRRGNLR
jgi:hypothetical protein